jgi:NAD-dependent deacetylase
MTERLHDMIEAASRGVFFGGAGVSTESDIPDFRSANGLYARKHGRYSPEEMLSHTFFVRHPEEFFEYYRTDILAPWARPNRAHYALARMERDGKLKAVITQNIDGLHTMAGSKTVYEVHGSVHRNYCMDCREEYDLDYVTGYECTVPRCAECGGIVRPDVVLYEESLPMEVLELSMRAVAQADLFIVGGTSLMVYPAAGLVQYFRGKNLVIINRDPTPFDAQASLVIRDSIGAVLDAAWPERE